MCANLTVWQQRNRPEGIRDVRGMWKIPAATAMTRTWKTAADLCLRVSGSHHLCLLHVLSVYSKPSNPKNTETG